MKTKFKLFFLTAAICGTSFLGFAQSDGSIDGDDAERIICKCTWAANCKASGSSGVCAQSEPGGNIQCSNYNSNC